MPQPTIDEIAAGFGVRAHPVTPRLASICLEADGMLYTSGHTSPTNGQLGADLSLEAACDAARESVVELLSGVLSVRGTLNDLAAFKLLGCVNAASGSVDHPIVMNAASQLVIDIFGEDRGAHVRSALGFTSLPAGAAVEIEAIFRVVGA